MSYTVLIPILLLMCAVTWAVRALPFFLKEDNRILRAVTDEDSPGHTLGPALIAAIAAVTIVPDFIGAVSAFDGAARLIEIVAYVVSLAVAVVVSKKTGNAGLAIILAMLVYGLAAFLH
ncbi:MAG: AzlD domain-containing protein [Methylobacteriaceae bacterium]|jgi:branched-subunit amino acid transport protein|nr:AzlD domain-containing protein [Methylobacteriaceae bacterium]